MKKLFPLIFIFFTLNLFAQKEADFWYFGRNTGVNFTSGNPVFLNDGALNTNEGSAVISDTNGNLLFYTDGITVYNKNHLTMANGNNLLGHPSSSQSAIIVPKPLDDNIYYIFTVTNQNGADGVKFSEVDISLNGGLGEVTIKNSSLPSSSGAFEKITSVRGIDCNTFWVITGDTNSFQSYLVDKDGVNTNPILSTYISNIDNRRGYLKVSPDGTRLVSANPNGRTFIYGFNALNGEITNGQTLSIDGENGYGVEFSRNSQKLYISTGGNDQGGAQGRATIFQFDLSTNPIARGIVNRVNNGFRGALQLASNGKIYYSRSSTSFLGVINSPEKKLNEVSYDAEGVSLGGRLASEGLPPFIQSFFLPIELTDPDTNQVINDLDLQFCTGQNKTIVPDALVGNNITYEWTFNNGATTKVISNNANLILTNLAVLDSGTYNLNVELVDNCGTSTQLNGTFNIEVFRAASATKPTDINFCDTDSNSNNNFNLATLKNAEILNGRSNTIFNVLYFDSLEKATVNSAGSDLPNPYQVNTVSRQTIYARVHNVNAPNTCFDITDFILEVALGAKPEQPTTYRLCDNTASGSDTDGTSNGFRLNTKDAQILGALNPAQFNVLYYANLADAQIGIHTNAIPKNVDHQVINNSQRIYVRVENKDNIDCNAISDDSAGSTFMSFELIVDPLPVLINNSVELIQCHNNPNLSTTVNLKLARPIISTNYTNETFEYYKTLANANDGTLQITGTDVEMYPVTGTAEAWVRVISDQNCFRVSKINVTVNFSADLIYNKTYIECDGFLDSTGNNTTNNSDTDGISTFDFSNSIDEIKAFFPVPSRSDLNVFFYETVSDRTASINVISDITNHRNNNPLFVNNQTIYAKIVNKTNNGCSGTVDFELQVNQVPIANIPTNFNLCDDVLSGSTTDGKNIGINLRDKVEDILGSTQNEANYIVTFHTSQTDADNLTSSGIANDTNFTNATPANFIIGDISEQNIFVRVQIRDSNPACYNANSSFFKIIINPLPLVTAITPLPFCDVANVTDTDPRNRIAQNIDFSAKEIEILNGRTNLRVAFYTSVMNAQNNGPEITNTINYDSDPTLTTFPTDFNTDDPGIQTIFYKVIDQTGNMCESVFETFNLLIYPEPNIPINISDYSDCDNETDSYASDINGINGNISLKNKIPEILTNYTAAEFGDFNITFYTSLADAESGNTTLALDENMFENSANNQTIFVRVENTKNSHIRCVNTQLSFNINIKNLPNFTVMGEENIDPPLIVCINNTPNTSRTLEAENPDKIYDYSWTDEVGNVLGNNSTLDVYVGGKYTITATEQFQNGCSRSRTIIVKESETATLTDNLITIIDETNNISTQDNISILIETANNILGKGEYRFAIRKDDTRITTSFQDEPLFENLVGGIYTIIVNDNNGCAPDTELQVSVIQFPKFFTPNNDGKNDTWSIEGVDENFYSNTSSLTIFDRFGKLVAKIPIVNQGWNGTYNGKNLPTNDYWFYVELIPVNTAKSSIRKNGHFSLLRK
jgi:gliding motility-associated-like protein